MARAGGNFVKVIPMGRYVGRAAIVGSTAKGAAANRARPSDGALEDTTAEWGARVAEAYAKGVEDGRMAALSEHAIAAEFDVNPEAARAEDAQIECIRRCFEQMEIMTRDRMREMETRVSKSVASILRTYMLEAEGQRVAAALLEHLNGLWSAGDQTRVHIKAPEVILSLLRMRMTSWPFEPVFEDADGVDVSIKYGDLHIETRLAEWARTLNAQNRS
jgi:hypothetical protein